MFQVHNRYAVLSFVVGLSLLASSVGCRNYGGCGYNSQACLPCNSLCGNVGIGSPTTVAAPGTYGVQIPSTAAGGGYYNRNAATANANSLLQPRGIAPTPTTSGPNLAPQRGWREAGTTGTTSTSQYTPGNNQNSQSVLASSSNTNSVLSPTQAQTQLQAQTQAQLQAQAQTQARVANLGTQNGLSFRDNQNYSTTTVDERLDRTRLAATDATNVRAPVGPNRTLVAQNPYGGVRSAGFTNPALRSPITTQDPRLAQNLITYQAAPVFTGQPVFGGVQSGAVQNRVANNVVPGQVGFAQQPVYYGTPTFAQPTSQNYPGLTSSQPTVLAQSTVYSDPARATTTASNGNWRASNLNGLSR